MPVHRMHEWFTDDAPDPVVGVGVLFREAGVIGLHAVLATTPAARSVWAGLVAGTTCALSLTYVTVDWRPVPGGVSPASTRSPASTWSTSPATAAAG